MDPPPVVSADHHDLVAGSGTDIFGAVGLERHLAAASWQVKGVDPVENPKDFAEVVGL